MGATTRTVTALFTDIVDSTKLMTKLGPEGAEELRVRHFAVIRAALSVHRGKEVKTLGDGFMAVFESTGDAVACAVTMQQSVAGENRKSPEDEVGLRVGLSAGDVSVDSDDYFGAPIVAASRLCSEAGGGQILAADVVRLLLGEGGIHRLKSVAPMELRGLPGLVEVCEVEWGALEEGATLRVALAEDNALLREAIASVLETSGVDVVLQTENADDLLAGLQEARPDVVVCDVRMPPTHTTEGIDAAEKIRADYPDIAVLVLSAQVEAKAAQRLLSGSTEGVGYLLKDKVGNVDELSAAIRTLASGGSTIDPAIVERLEIA